VRELLPWSVKPEVTALLDDTHQHEQSAIFRWKDISFIVGINIYAPAEKNNIWGDFENVLRAKGGSCIGLYVSLFDSDVEAITSAEKLCKEKIHIILLQGNVWEELKQEDLAFEKLLDYMIAKVRTGSLPTPPPIVEIQEWLSERETASVKIRELLKGKSATFLRRHKNPRHQDLYVKRYVDERVVEFARNLRPSRLLTRSREVQHGDSKTIVERQLPEQICVIRDLSGSGKTTLSVDLALNSTSFFSMSQSAIESNVDEVDEILREIEKFKSEATIGLPDALYISTRDILLKCAPITTDYEINNLFVDQRIAHWKNKIPQSKTPIERAETLIAFLINQENNENVNGLVAFLQVLSDRLSPKDKYFHDLRNLANEINNFVLFHQKSSSEANSYGLGSLLIVDKPIIFIVDSLDEANMIPNKKAEILSLIRFVTELNLLADKSNLLAFPVGLIFTVREEYWRRWEAIFEGQNSITLSKRISTFTGLEFREAMEKYSSAYDYRVSAQINRDVKELLSVPFNLQIFSEANEYQGFVSTINLGGDVLHLFFSAKGESVLRQRILGLSNESFMGLCSDIALSIIGQGVNNLSRAQILGIIENKHVALNSNAEQVLLLLESEQILVKMSDQNYRIRHTQILEYLTSYAIIRNIDRKGSVNEFDNMITAVINSDIASIFSVHEYIRHVTYKQFPHLSKTIDEYYSKSNVYMSQMTITLRSMLAAGTTISKEDITLVLKNTDTTNPETTWDSFFILAAKNNHQSDEKVLQAFKIAWISNSERTDRWKLIDKLSERNLLLSDVVLHSVLESNSWKEWQVYLGCIVNNVPNQQFIDFISEIGKESIFECLNETEGEEWRYVAKLMTILLEGKTFVPGEML